MKLTMFTDGGSRGNPGNAASAVYLPDSGGCFGRFIGTRTNNEAEYEALIMALEFALQEHCHDVKVFSDSELMARQMTGRYKANPGTKIYPLYERATKLVGMLDHFDIEHIRREHNKEADAEVNRVLDAQQ